MHYRVRGPITLLTKNIIEDDFNHYYDMAEEGTRHYQNGGSSNPFITFILILLNLIPFIIFGFIFAVAAIIIVAAIWYYVAQNNTRDSENKLNEK